MLINLILGIFLLICTVTDIRFKEINIVVLVIFALAGAALFFIYRPVSLFEEITGLLFGIVFIGLWALTDGKVGLGDGLMMIVTGIFSGARENGALIMTAMLFSAVYSIFFVIIKKADRNTRFAFAPFVFASFICRQAVLLWR